MFHHFHDVKDKRHAQGSITSIQFEKIIINLGIENILSPIDWLKNYNKKNNKKYCISFDDALLCQYNYALPILKKYNIKSIFFIYSSVFNKKIIEFEIFRRFRYLYYSSFIRFYNDFLEEYYKYQKIYNNIKNICPFYTKEDIYFRIIRDQILKKNEFSKIMNSMISKKTTIKKLSKNVWMKNHHLKLLSAKNHLLGLHGYNHSFDFKKLTYDQQESELTKNSNHLFKVTKKKPTIIAYPSNSYNKNTINISKKLGVKFGFRANHEDYHKYHKNFHDYEIPRLDHSVLMKNIK